MSKSDTRNVSNRQLPRRHDPSMTSNNAAGLVNQDGICETKFLNACGNLRYLSIAVGAAVPGIRNQLINFYLLDVHLYCST